MTSEEENEIWFDILRRDGDLATARRIAKRPLYRAYVQRWPYDGKEPPLHLDFEVNIPGEGPVPFYDIVPDETASALDGLIDDERVSAFKATLTPRQLKALELMSLGFKPMEIYDQFGYKNTGGIRYLRWAIRRKYKVFVKANQ